MTAAAMAFPDMSLDQLGAQANAHYKAGEKANQRANDQAKSAGLYLAEAQRRIDTDNPYGERTKAWEGFLRDHCPVARTRAEQLIAVATGKATEVEIQEATNKRKQEFRARTKGGLSFRNDKVQQILPPPNPQSPEPDPRADLMARIIQKLEGLSLAQLHDIERNIPEPSAPNSGFSVRLAA